ncbi:C40 family peptidase [Limosilactobacillus reuteri]|uniref:LysM peptidoglycan-binding domain-containing protein n=1 Tax=Limosilactobacillus reuteri TaxID=1598 RepID=A0A347T6Z2_LIMRT|nr:C40 family peptidase [Limosilactobacillus reuteri]AXX73691.1 LysM peptidoglycan-binding domain-containing protein [Limosilactobacillus reuteri]MRG68999.1 LysM peptidoglycan-binding domain-containing protein [Limosilactobacillus reuteri]WLR80083.1 LysM peptidoglycan-binding domain-containing protein [Limosilactobacillus reuteri]
MSKKRTHHSNNHRSRGVFAGAVSALSLLAVTTQAVNAEQLTVKSGDTIWGLAKQHGLSVSALEQANPSVKKINDSIDLITVGQQLTLPTAQHDASADLNADGSYTVKPGDTLSSIADRYNVTVSQLMAWNNLSANDSLYIGQQLSVTGPAISTAVNAPVVSAPVADASVSTQQPVAQSTDATSSVQVQTSSVQVQTSAVASASVPQQDVASSQPAGTVPSQSAANSNTTLANNTATVATGSSAANSVATATDAAQTTTANTVQATSTSAENSVAPQTQNVAVSQAASTAVNTTALYGQSFVQAAPVASQAPQSQTVPASQATVNVQNSNAAASQQTTAVTSQTQPQQSQVAASQPAQQAATTNQDLQHGSVVSLATKIADSNSVPYVWGGESLSGMDCSGLVKYVYANAEGKQLPHYTGALENCVDQHPVSEAKPGDLLFWGNHGSTYHTAIYTGNNQYVAAAHPGTNVSTYTISPYFNPSFAGTVK